MAMGKEYLKLFYTDKYLIKGKMINIFRQFNVAHTSEWCARLTSSCRTFCPKPMQARHQILAKE
jgi:hypothetical protein